MDSPGPPGHPGGLGGHGGLGGLGAGAWWPDRADLAKSCGKI